MSQFQVMIQDLQATPMTVAGDVGPDIEGLAFSTTDPGGPKEAEFSLIPERMEAQGLPLWARRHYRIYIADNEGVFWRGWINRLGIAYGGAEPRISVHCIGIAALADQMNDTGTDVKGLQTSAAMGNVITNLVLAETITQAITASGFTLDGGAALTVKGKASAVLNLLAGFGNSSDVLYQWDFYPTGKAGAITFTAGPRSSTLQYYMYLADLSGWGFESFEDTYANRVRVWYNNGASSVAVDNADEQAAEPTGIGKIVELEIYAPEVVHVNDATQLGQVLLEVARKTIMVPSGSFRLVGNVPVWDEYNHLVPPHRVRAGRYTALTDVRPYHGLKNNLDWMNSFYIKETRYTEDTQTLEVMPSTANILSPYMASVYNLLGGRHRL